jgi:predicted acyl esterase
MKTSYWHSAVLFCFMGILFAEGVEGMENRARPQDPFVFEKNISIPTDDGSFVMANVFRPKEAGRYPVIMSMSVYGKDLATKDLYVREWKAMNENIPGLCKQSSCRYHTWETLDPELWVPEGYVLIRVDARGSGKSPGKLDPFSPREIRDFYNAIEWASRQPWSTGKVGLAGISYNAINQWLVASLQPPSLAAIVPWEGWSDNYRDNSRHGGIYSNVFRMGWFARQVLPLQHGNTASPYRDLDDGAPIAGDKALSPEQLAANRIDLEKATLDQPLDGPSYRERSADFSKITIPVLSGANWGGMGLHARGNFEGFYRSASKNKWLQVHGSNHRDPFYQEEGQGLQKEFFDHYLKGKDNGWDKRPSVILKVRHADGTFKNRNETEWPLARTAWTKLHLDPQAQKLRASAPSTASEWSYLALESGATFKTDPFEKETEITGPVMANLWVSSTTEDMDIFATLQLFTPDNKEVTFEGASEPAVPITQGWLRVSHRKLDPNLTTPWRPYHAHDEIQRLVPRNVYEVQVELWPTCIVVPKGYTLVLKIQGKDFSRSEKGGLFTGSGPFLHNHPKDRPLSIFGGINTIYGGGKYRSYLQIPVVPHKN